MSKKESDDSPLRELESLNADELDIEELERRIEMASTLPDGFAWICGADCGNNCIGNCTSNCIGDCPSNCIGNCPANCVANVCGVNSTEV